MYVCRLCVCLCLCAYVRTCVCIMCRLHSVPWRCTLSGTACAAATLVCTFSTGKKCCVTSTPPPDHHLPPLLRLDMEGVLAHPFFWEPADYVNFFASLRLSIGALGCPRTEFCFVCLCSCLSSGGRRTGSPRRRWPCCDVALLFSLCILNPSISVLSCTNF